MMTEKHTPGPWVCEMSNKSTGGYYEPPETEWLVVTEDREPRPNNVIASFWDTDWGYEALYNARLIAAAPDLLEACKALVDAEKYVEKAVKTEEARVLARAAIAKAKGES